MKKIFIGIMAMIATLTAFIACEDDIDEVAQWNRVVDNSAEILGLKDACDKINYNVTSFTKIVEAQQQNLTITAAYPNENGYLIVFSDGTFAQLLNGKDGADGKDGKDGVDGKDGQDGLNGTNGVDGKDGKDGYVPAIAIKKDVDGIYYWTCDGAFMIDAEGNKVPAQGKDGKDGVDGVNGINGTNGLVAQFMVSEAGELQYRYNDTDAWTSLGNVKGADGANGADGVNGTNGTNGINGVDGKTPTFKIEAGNLMVSYDGENWSNLGTVKGADGVNGVDGANGTNGSNGADGINGTNGNDGITPEFKIEDGKWFVSYNNKATWVELGQATGDKGEKGDKGDAGLNGTNGTNGTDGINGTNGTNGKDGITPKLKIVDGYWYISYDGGVTYETEPLGKATGDKGADGANGTNGVDGKTPTFKVEGGVLFVSYDETTWKSLGLVKGVSGEAGKTPTMKIEGGDWYVSYDDGETWANLGQATGDKGANGTNGTNGITPTFKVEGGNLYVSYNEGASWSNLGNVKGADGVNGTNGTNGTNGAAGKDGVTPKLKITDGYWYISYDNEKTWTKLDKATGANGTNGTNGVDGKTPQFKIEGGALLVSYDSKTWTSLGIVKGADGKDGVNGTNGTNGTNGAAGKDGVTPKMKITDGYWYVSYDNGTTWTKLDKATGANGANGTNGTDGITPTFKVEGGNLYVSYNEGASWTNLGNVKGANGTNGTAGVTPKFKITDGYWYVSYDNGTTWTKLDKATGANGVDGKTPELSINSEGHLISTVNGVATDLGNVTGATPVIKVEDGKWKVSNDGGTTWTEIEGSSTVGGGTSNNPSLPGNGVLNGYEYVDLGLPSGTKWATMNVGASKNNDYGTYFAWGEIAPAPSNNYSYTNCKAYGKSYAQLSELGIIRSATKPYLTAEYDAATANWGEGWRMPTKADFDELLNECLWTKTEIGGVSGYRVESAKVYNANWIFLPCAGFHYTLSNYVGSKGYYWSSTALFDTSAYSLYLDSISKDVGNHYSRNNGCTVRPVTE